MKYEFSSSLSFPTVEELKAIKKSIKAEFPNGPKIKHTVVPEGSYSFNEISQNIAFQLNRSVKAK